MTFKRENRTEFTKAFKGITISKICDKLHIPKTSVYSNNVGENKLEEIKKELKKELEKYIANYL